MTNKTNWIRSTKDIQIEGEAAKQYIYALKEEAETREETRQEKIRIAHEKRYGDN